MLESARGGQNLPRHFSQIVMRDRVTGKPRGFGFITFDTEEAAQRACEDDHTLDGRTVRVPTRQSLTRFAPNPPRSQDSAPLTQIDAKPSVPQDSQQRPRSKKVFVGGLAPETTPGACAATCAAAIAYVLLMAQACMRNLLVVWQVMGAPRVAATAATRLFLLATLWQRRAAHVRPSLHCAEQFKLYFERYGKVVEAQIMVDHTSNRSRGFG